MTITNYPSDEQLLTTICSLLSGCFAISKHRAKERIYKTLDFLLDHRIIHDSSLSFPKPNQTDQQCKDYTYTIYIKINPIQYTTVEMRLIQSEDGFNTEVEVMP